MSDSTSQMISKTIARLEELSSLAQEVIDDLGNMAGVADCESERDALESRLASNLQSQFTTLCAAFDDLRQPSVSQMLREGFARYGHDLAQWDYEDYTGAFLSPVQIFLGQFIPLLKMRVDDAIGGFEQAQVAILENILKGTATILENAKIVPTCETDINQIMKAMIKGAFPDSIPCPQIPTVVKTYEPEMGVPSLGALVEYKYATTPEEMKQCVDGVFADTCGYAGDEKWKRFYAVFFQTAAFYDQAQMDEQFKLCSKSWKPIIVTGTGTKKKFVKKQQTVAVSADPVPPVTPPPATPAAAAEAPTT